MRDFSHIFLSSFKGQHAICHFLTALWNPMGQEFKLTFSLVMLKPKLQYFHIFPHISSYICFMADILGDFKSYEDMPDANKIRGILQTIFGP